MLSFLKDVFHSVFPPLSLNSSRLDNSSSVWKLFHELLNLIDIDMFSRNNHFLCTLLILPDPESFCIALIQLNYSFSIVQSVLQPSTSMINFLPSNDYTLAMFICPSFSNFLFPLEARMFYFKVSFSLFLDRL